MLGFAADMSSFAQSLNSIVEIAKAVSVDPNELEKLPVPLTQMQGLTEKDKSFSLLETLRSKSTEIGLTLREDKKEGSQVTP